MRIGFLGFGNMAQAIADGLLAGQEATTCQGSKPWELAATALHLDKLEKNCQVRGMRAFPHAADLASWSDLLFLAVKPWQLADSLPPLANKLKGKIIVNIAAGKGFADIEALLPGTAHITALPNLPVAVGQGLLIAEEKHSLSPQQLSSFEEVCNHIGELVFLPPDQFSAGASISGCGPAFAAMYVEALADAGVKYGLKREIALSLATKMLEGSGRLLATGRHPGVLKDQVCSPGGTTIRGVLALERAGFRAAVAAAIDAIEGQ